jgi:N12 class adenine-specific DNA methylase/predicted RNA methylase
VLATLTAEKRHATAEEQRTLARYVGWGGLPQAFDHRNADWRKEFEELSQVLTGDGYADARRSTQDAHYTPVEVIRGIYKGLGRLGFTGGRVADFGAGTGHFIGAMPDDMRATTEYTAVELDTVTAAIGQQLYPKAAYINRGFETVFVPSGHFDAVVGNPPFGQQSLYDADHRELSDFSIHNYFLAKSIDKLRPGGVMAVVVSRYFMDAANTAAREHIAERAHLLGAIRLPNTAFKENALTEVTTDIVFFQRAREGEVTNKRWVEIEPIIDYDSNDQIHVNRYYVDHPQQMLGTMAMVRGAHGDKPELLPLASGDLSAHMDQALQILPEGRYVPVDRAEPEPGTKLPALVLPDSVKVGGHFITPTGELARRLPDVLTDHAYELVVARNAVAAERMRAMVGIRDTLRCLMACELTGAFEWPADAVAGESVAYVEGENPPAARGPRLWSEGKDSADMLREELNRRYDKFVGRYGHISAQANRLAMRDDPEYPLLFALERDYDKGVSPEMARKHGVPAKQPSAKKAAIFSRRVLTPRREVTSVDSPKDALVVSMNERGRIDMAHLCRLCRQDEAQVIEALRGRIYFDPETEQWQTSDQYLTGNVKHKFAVAEDAAKADPRYAENADALRAVIPADIEAVDISVQLGSTWVPADVVGQFVRHLLGDVRSRLSYHEALGKWTVDIAEGDHTACRVTWGTGRYPANELIEAILQQRAVQVKDQVGRNENGNPVYELNAVETTAANQKADEIRQAFLDWLWEDKDRRHRLERLYNDRFNTNVAPRYDGSHLTMHGTSAAITLNPHQKDAIWRGVQEGSVLLDHVVGSGKTFECIGIVMEAKRMGLMNKAMLVVPNHLLLQWKDSFYELYPNANILVADKTDFKKENRERLFARIATNDWDAVIVAHSSFKRIGIPKDTLDTILTEQIDDLTDAILQMKREKGDRVTIKEMEKAKDRMEARMKKAADTGSKDKAITFDELGVDALLVDEAHMFKNLQITTSMSRVSGLGNLEGSEMAFDLFAKCRYLQMKQEGRGVYFATGTPISNTIAELYTMNRYMRYDDMRKRGIAHFDAWASTFGQVVTGWELDATGVNYRLNSRFAKFQNVPELVALYRTFADVITQTDLQRQAAERGTRFPVPKLKTGKPINVIVDRSPAQARFMGVQETVLDDQGEPMRTANGAVVRDWNPGSIIYRMENLPDDPRIDNPLKITNEARKAGLDFRLIDSGASDHPNSKVNACVENLLTLYREWGDRAGTQLVFCDLSTPKAGGSKPAPVVADPGTDGEDAEAEDEISMDELLAGSGPFSVYDDIKRKLIERGVPEAEVRFIHDAHTDAQKAKLFQDMNRGAVRFLLGSTAKMGAGTNVQRLLVAIHHLDAPWRPSDLEQRDGRGIRQGNHFYQEDPEGFELSIFRYATKQTYDSRMWQTIEYKAAGIEQFRRGDSLTRVIDDVASEAANAAEMKAAATGNPLIFQQVKLTADLRKLEAVYSNYVRGRHSLEKRIDWLSDKDTRAERAVQRWNAEIAIRNQHPGDKVPFILPNGRKLGEDDRKVLMEHVLSSMKIALDRVKMRDDSMKTVGTYRGFEIQVYGDRWDALCFRVTGAGDYESDNLRYKADEKFSVTGFLTRVDNYLGTFEWRIREAQDLLAREASELEKAKQELLKPFAQMAQLEDLRADVRDVMAELQRIQADDSYVSTWRPRSAAHEAPDHKPAKQVDAFSPALRSSPAAA